MMTTPTAGEVETRHREESRGAALQVVENYVEFNVVTSPEAQELLGGCPGCAGRGGHLRGDQRLQGALTCETESETWRQSGVRPC